MNICLLNFPVRFSELKTFQEYHGFFGVESTSQIFDGTEKMRSAFSILQEKALCFCNGN